MRHAWNRTQPQLLYYFTREHQCRQTIWRPSLSLKSSPLALKAPDIHTSMIKTEERHCWDTLTEYATQTHVLLTRTQYLYNTHVFINISHGPRHGADQSRERITVVNSCYSHSKADFSYATHCGSNSLLLLKKFTWDDSLTTQNNFAASY